MDSCVTAAIAAREHGAANVAAMHISYGQRTEAREREAFQKISQRLGISQRMLIENRSLQQIGGSALTDKNIPVPESGHVGAGIPITYVPFRNAHFLSAAVSWAEVLGAEKIYIGAVAQDSSGYPDCRPEYYDAFNQVIRVGTKEGGIEIVAPLIALRKAEIIRRGLELGAPLELTWSCYTEEREACGACDSCVLRLRAFEAAGVRDPLPYAVRAAAR
jgi:7-cyano-7-deazaguanine synthase